MSLEEAKQFLRDNWGNKRVKCPCCGQSVDKTKRKFNTGMALFLIALFKLNLKEQKYYHASEILKKINAGTKSLDYSVLKYWKVILPRNDISLPEKRQSGYWKITGKGIDFVKEIIKVPSHVYTFNQSSFGYSDTEITIRQALGNKFNYQELMNT